MLTAHRPERSATRPRIATGLSDDSSRGPNRATGAAGPRQFPVEGRWRPLHGLNASLQHQRKPLLSHRWQSSRGGPVRQTPVMAVLKGRSQAGHAPRESARGCEDCRNQEKLCCGSRPPERLKRERKILLPWMSSFTPPQFWTALTLPNMFRSGEPRLTHGHSQRDHERSSVLEPGFRLAAGSASQCATSRLAHCLWVTASPPSTRALPCFHLRHGKKARGARLIRAPGPGTWSEILLLVYGRMAPVLRSPMPASHEGSRDPDLTAKSTCRALQNFCRFLQRSRPRGGRMAASSPGDGLDQTEGDTGIDALRRLWEDVPCAPAPKAPLPPCSFQVDANGAENSQPSSSIGGCHSFLIPSAQMLHCGCSSGQSLTACSAQL